MFLWRALSGKTLLTAAKAVKKNTDKQSSTKPAPIKPAVAAK